LVEYAVSSHLVSVDDLPLLDLDAGDARGRTGDESP